MNEGMNQSANQSIASRSQTLCSDDCLTPRW